MAYVETVYGEKSLRMPSITQHKNESAAKLFVKTCLKWGIDIVSCSIISIDLAEKKIQSGLVEFEVM